MSTYYVGSHIVNQSRAVVSTENSEGLPSSWGAEALRYKPAGRGFDSRWFQWNFSVT